MESWFGSGAFSSLAALGWSWSALTYSLTFSRREKALMAQSQMIAVAGLTLALSLWLVTSEMAHLGDMLGGITPLDGQYGNGRAQIVEFAEARGTEGPREYVAFQSGAEALAPQTFLGFLMAVYRGPVSSQKAQGALTALALPISHRSCSANTPMPIIMHASLRFVRRHIAARWVMGAERLCGRPNLDGDRERVRTLLLPAFTDE